MKIRLVSIEGKIADPLYNAEQMIKAIEKAEADKMDLLVFPRNSLRGNSLGDVGLNNKYKEIYKAAKEKLNLAIENAWVTIAYNENLDSDIYQIKNYAGLDSLEYMNQIEKVYKDRSSKDDLLHILCQGRGTESTCKGVFSNEKIIAYHGKILASNLESDANVLDYDFDPNKLVSRYPYLDDIDDVDRMFRDALTMQSVGLYGKMKSMNRFKICMGVSGGLDSTISLLVCVEAFKKYGLPLKDIIGVTMPGLGTTERTYQNSLKLMKSLGITIEEIDLKPLLKMHLKNISQPEGKFDVTYEQTQSRERTQVLLDIANRDNAIMIGTGCMSEFALGWMTYGGDHLSMFAINIGLPKTVVKMYAKWFINRYNKSNKRLAATIKDILEGPVSPELLPIDEKGEQHEKTESIIGDYMVQDFFIYHIINSNYSISELFEKACIAFPEYEPKQIFKWLKIFTLRFFTRQFKKNCYGDGLQLFNYSVSPFTGFSMPSDIDNTIWQKEIDELAKKIGE